MLRGGKNMGPCSVGSTFDCDYMPGLQCDDVLIQASTVPQRSVQTIGQTFLNLS